MERHEILEFLIFGTIACGCGLLAAILSRMEKDFSSATARLAIQLVGIVASGYAGIGTICMLLSDGRSVPASILAGAAASLLYLPGFLLLVGLPAIVIGEIAQFLIQFFLVRGRNR